MAKIKPNKSWKALKKKVRDFPKQTGKSGGVIHTGIRKHARGVRQAIIDVIESGSAKPKLAKSTLLVRSVLGGSTKPLEGEGGMIKGLKITRRKNGWSGRPVGKHQGSGMSQQAIWAMHEHGAVTKITDEQRIAFVRLSGALGLLDGSKTKPGGRRKTVRRIPARKPFQRGVNKYVRDEIPKAKKEIQKELRKFIVPLNK